MKISIDRPPYYTIRIEKSPSQALAFTPQEAHNILAALLSRRDMIIHLALNFYECSECGGLHPNGQSHQEATQESEEG